MFLPAAGGGATTLRNLEKRCEDSGGRGSGNRSLNVFYCQTKTMKPPRHIDSVSSKSGDVIHGRALARRLMEE